MSAPTQRTVQVELVERGALPGHGTPIVGVHGLEGRLIESSGRVRIVLATEWERPIAEHRWQVDQVIRRARRFLDLRAIPVALFAPGLDEALVNAIALDLRRAFGALAGVETGAGPSALAADLERYAQSEDLFRRWVNEDPSTRTSLAIAEDVQAFARVVAVEGTLEVEVLTEGELRERGLNLLLAVGQASESSPPRLVLAHWTPSPALQDRAGVGTTKSGGARPQADTQSARPIMLLGKGITFDTGGINVKPYESFVSHMRNDMAGAALAFAAFKHLVEGGFPQPLLLAIPTCENAIGERAMRPGTVVRSHRGLRVKIDHTDAEGRLVLADALSYAEERYAPALTFCFATLTTAALQAYGPYATPVHFAPPEIEAALAEAALATGEDLHFFPSRAWHFEANRDDEADLKNTARLTGYMPHAAGSRNAAHFLLHFARGPIVHADIFASTWNWGGDHPGTGFGATGAPLRTFLRALERLAIVDG
jgi:leucyl aminopeptidase